METGSPTRGQQYMLPSKQHIVIEQSFSNDSYACRYVNPDGTHDGIRITKATVTLTLPFLLRYARHIR